MLVLELSNFYAWYSIEANNANRALRILCRKSYQLLADAWAILSPSYLKRIAEYKNGRYTIDTYPQIYADPRFAGWTDQLGVPVVDRRGLVVRSCTSYCAYKIRQATGVWPRMFRRTALVRDLEDMNPILSVELYERRPVCWARDWLAMLVLQGYDAATEPLNGGRYIGVDPMAGERGEVVWFEYRQLDGQVTVSTYRQREHQILTVEPGKYRWVRIV